MPGRQLAVYSRGGAEEDAGGRRRRRRRRREDGTTLRNLTTPTQSGGEKTNVFVWFGASGPSKSNLGRREPPACKL